MLKKILLSILAVITLLIISVGIYYRFFIYKAPLISAEDLAAVTLMPLPAKLEMKSGVLDLSNGENGMLLAVGPGLRKLLNY